MTRKVLGRIASARPFVFAMVSLAALAAQATSTSYMNASGVPDTADCTEITSSSTTLNTGWYVVNDTVTISSTVTVNGDVNLILADGAKLTVNGTSQYAGISVVKDGETVNSLTIYCQSGGTGILDVTGGYAGAGIGGNNKTSAGTGLGDCGTVTIYGGVVSAKGTGDAAGIGGGDYYGKGGTVSIHGGKVTAQAGNNAAGIGRGYGSSTDNGTLIVGSGLAVMAGSSEATATALTPASGTGEVTLSGQKYFSIAPPSLKQMTSELFVGYHAATPINVPLADTIHGGTTPYTFTPKGDDFPAWLSVSGTSLVGTPPAAGVYTVKLAVSDSSATPLALDGDATYTLNVEVTGNVEVSFIGDGGAPQVQTCTVVEKTMTTLTEGWYVLYNNVSFDSSVTISGNVKLVLMNGKTMTVTTSDSDYNAPVHVAPNNSLTIYGQSGGTGRLEASAGVSIEAGIGGNSGQSNGAITINGGTIVASGNAGIGGGYQAAGGSVTINGGTVTATSTSGAGIGGGSGSTPGAGGTVTINGGTVTATGGYSGAGIGGGSSSAGQGTLTVSARVTVKAGASANPTAELAHGAGGAIDLSTHYQYYTAETTGPTPLSQTQNAFAAYIDDAFELALPGTISGGTGSYTFTLKTPASLPAWLTRSGDTLSGTPTATLDSCTLTFTVQDTEETSFVDDFTYTITVTAKPKSITYKSGETTLTGLTPTNYVEGTATTLALTAPAATGYAFAGWYGNPGLSGLPVTAISAEATGDQTFWAKFTPIEYTITYMDGVTPMTGLTPTNYTIEAAATLPATATKAGYGFYGWYTNSTFTGSEVTTIPAGSTGNKTFYAQWGVAKSNETYIDASGHEQTVECVEIGSDTTTLQSGWYVVNGNVTINGKVTVAGNVNLLLCDGASLTVNASSSSLAIEVKGANSLTIYGQENGNGTLTATANGWGPGIGSNDSANPCGTIIVNGGIVTATGSTGAGIGGGYNKPGGTVIVNGGTVIANGDSGAGGIGGYGTDYKATGSLTVADNAIVMAKTSRSAAFVVKPHGANGVITLEGEQFYKIVVPKTATVSYRDTDGVVKNASCKLVTADINNLVDGWYAVIGNLDFGATGIFVSGDVKLIVADGASLAVTGTSNPYSAGINVPVGASFTVYGQAEGTGTLTATGGYFSAGIGGNYQQSAGTITINGCNVTAVGNTTYSGGAGIGGGGNGGNGGTVTVNGGRVEATGNSGAGIGRGGNGANGTLTVASSMSVMAGANSGSVVELARNETTGEITLEGQAYFVITRAGQTPLAQTANAFAAYVGDTFEVALANTVSGGTSPYTFVQKSGTLPTGLSFANGVISGAPVAVGSASVVFTVTDSGSPAQSVDFTYTITVTAKPKKITYYNGAVEITGLTPTNYVEGTVTALASSAPTATGYEFAGWYGNSGLTGDPVSAIPAVATGDQEFWAKFTPIEYTITYMDGATPMTGLTPTNYTIEAAATLPATATKAGYGFYGWYTNSTFTGSEVTAIPVGSTGNKTFYAKWGVQRLSTAYVNAAGVAMPNEDCIPISSGTSELEDGWYVVNGEVTADSPITVSGDVNVILADGARLSVTGSQYGAAINVAAGNSLTIYCQSGRTGMLEATATSGIAAVIGSGNNQNGGAITINGGVVVATGSGSGIGSGFGGTCGTITINGGEVTAQGGSSGAGIGSCMNGVAGTVVINGGTVTATSDGQAGIGGGYNVAGGTVTINGGTVTATGGSSTPGIGAGNGSSDHGSLTVGANVVVKAGANANPTEVINPNGETDLSSLLTGQRYFTAETVGDAPLAQRTGAIAASENTAFEISLATTISGGRPPYEFSGTGPGELGLTLASDGTLSGTLAAGTYNFSVNVSDAESADITANYTLTVAYTTKLIYYFDGGTRIVGHEPSTYVPGEVVELVPYEKEGYTFDGWYLDGEFLNGPYASISALETTSKTFFGKWTKNDAPGPQGDGVNVTFINAEGISQTTNCVGLTTEITTLVDGGWYVVTNALNYNGSGITVAGTANLVIADDASLTVGGTSFYAGITLPAGSTLNVFGQANGSGTLTATGNYGAGIGGGYGGLVGDMGGAASCGTLVVNGGNVTAIGSMESAGIGGGYHGAGGTLVVNRGTVTATGGNNGAGIGGGNSSAGGTVTVNGGSVTATGGSMGAGIGGGSGAIGGTVVVNGGTVTATGGMSNSYGIGAGAGIDLNPGTLKIAPALAAKAGAAANPQTEFYADEDGYVTFGSAYQYCTVTASGAIPYIDADGTEKAARCRAVSSSVYQRVVLDEEWYVVEGDVTVQRGMSVSGNVKLILVDGASLTVTQDHDSWAGISVTNGNSLTIYGQSAQSGVLTVTGGYNAAGIGGDNATACGTITINGGVIAAQGGQSGAGMGGGKNGNGGTVVVNRGTVTVTGGSSGAGIGGGENGAAVAVTINGGTVTANGGEFASAIGGGLSGNGGSVTVNGGSVSAVGGDYGGTAIGKGMSGSDNGTLTVAARILVKSGTVSDNLTIVNPTVVAATLVPDGKRYSTIVPAVVCPIAYVDDDGVTQLANIEPAHYVVGVGATLPATATKTGCVFDGWYASSALSGDPVTEISASAEGAQIVYAKWIYASMVSFVDASGQPRQEYCRRLTASSERTLSTGWYYVDGEVTLDTGLAVSGDVTLILADGAKLSVQGAGRKAGITVTTGNSLTIYGQAAGTGKLFATGGQYSAGIGGNYYYDDVGNCGAVTINGGIVVAKGTNGGAGIGGGDGGDGGEVRVNGGVVVADGGVYVGYGIGAGNNRSNHGSLRVGDGVQVFAGSSGANATRQVPEGGVVTLDGKAYYEIDKSALAAEGTYLTFSSDEVFTISALKRWDGMVQYSTNATLWTVWDGTAISASSADGRYLLHFRGIGNTKLCGRNDDCAAWTITGANVACNGSIENLRDYAGIAPVMAGNAYKQMFMNCTALASAPALPATTITNDCYKGLFYGCTALVNPPALPATELAANCYQEMFSGCTSLATLPVLPATNLANSCYYRMFYGCSSIKIYTSGDGIEWSIPADAVAPAGAWSTMMFYQTGGDFTSSPEIGVTYYVVAPEATEYSITYMDGAEEMTGLTPATYLTGEGATLPTASTVTKPGWLFIGWHVSSDCTDPAVLTIAANATGDKTFYADWEEVGEPEFTIVNGTLTAVNLRGNTAIMIPDEVYDINMQVFTNCTYLESVMIPTTVTNIGYAAFQGCSALTELTIPGSVEAIGQAAFWGCTSLTNLTLVDGVKYIGDYAFWGCSSLTNGVDGLYFPDSVESIGTDAFESCGHLTKVSLPGAMYVAGAPNHPAFNHVITEVTYRVLEPVFHVDGNNTLQSVELNGFTEITIPSTVRAIAAGALADAVSLESVTIPSSVTNIKVRAFAGCTGLTSVTMAEGPVAIGAQAFYGCTGLTRVTIPDSVTTLEDGVFWGCTSLSGVTVGSGVTQIDELTFQGCTSLSSVTFRGNVTHIGTHAFAGCSNLSNQTFPDSLEDIATDAFKECVSIKMVTIPAGVLIHSFAFRDCTDLKNVKVGKGCTIEPWAFYGCTRVKSVSIGRNKVPLLQQARLLAAAPQLLTADPDACTIGSYAFFGCGDLDEVELGSTVENIGGGAFAGCPKLTTIDIEEGNDSYKVEGGMLLTKDGSALVCAFGAETSMAVPSGVVTVATGAFAGYATLSNVTLSASVVTIGEAAFSNCTVLATATIQSNVTSIAANAFYGTALATVYVSKGDTSHIRGLVQGSGYSLPVTYIELGDEPVVTEDWPENPASVEGQTAAAAFGVTGELANAKADDLATWAKAKGVDYTNRETIIPDAFLLNCANTAAAVATATEDAEEAIKITAITIVNGVPQLTYASEYGNGQVVIQGSATIGSTASWHDGKQSGDRFFKTVLRLKSSNE